MEVGMPRWKSEAEMCAAMVPVYREAGLTVYPETSEWDQLLVAADGMQIGVQAKLRANFGVLDQARIPWPRQRVTGPDVRAVLIAKAPLHFRSVAETGLGLWVIEAEDYMAGSTLLRCFANAGLALRDMLSCAQRTGTTQRCWLPPFVPTVAAGVPAPRRVTKWRVKAIALCERLRTKGYVTRKDFMQLKLSLEIWLRPREGKPAWLVQERGTRPARFLATPGVELPDVGYREDTMSTDCDERRS